MGASRHARVEHQENEQPRRRGSNEAGDQKERLRGYSRNGVVGRVRDVDGHMFWPEFRRPVAQPSAADDGNPSSTYDSTTGTSSRREVETATEIVNIKQEHSEMPMESGETATLRIENFRRPFTLSAVQAFVQQCGHMVDGGFWMDNIKTHCYVTFASVNVARELKKAIDGTVWPAETGLKLSVTYSNVTALEVITNGPPTARAQEEEKETLKRKASEELVPRTRVIRGRGAPASIDSRFLKTETKPMLYYLPVPENDVTFRRQNREWERRIKSGGSVKSNP